MLFIAYDVQRFASGRYLPCHCNKDWFVVAVRLLRIYGFHIKTLCRDSHYCNGQRRHVDDNGITSPWRQRGVLLPKNMHSSLLVSQRNGYMLITGHL